MPQGEITKAVIRMYRMGTGDCFVVKFFMGEKPTFTMMVDCGVWQGSVERLTPFMLDLKDYVNGKVDLLVVTHEHVDHVSVFDICRDVFKDGFEVKKAWMGWTENDMVDQVARWKSQYGEKKKAVRAAAKKLTAIVNDASFKAALRLSANGDRVLSVKERYAATLEEFASLHLDDAGKEYKGLLAGMKFVKEELAIGKVDYLYPGDIVKDLPGLPGIKFYVLGPPRNWADIEVEAGKAGESYQHNKELKGLDAFAASVLRDGNQNLSILPFEEKFETKDPSDIAVYSDPNNAWQKIDEDWLMSAGSLALRINSTTNNLSLALAIEAEESKKVLLFPGDAEYGSWASWHNIDWKGLTGLKKKPLTEDLLNRTVFYKVAHHTSHNGTAQRQGLEMMNHPELTAMATLDYNVIAPAWKNTMPNRAMLKELLSRTQGRIIIMNENELYYDFNRRDKLSDRIASERKKMSEKAYAAFSQNLKIEAPYIEYTVDF